MTPRRTLTESVAQLEPRYVQGARPLEFWAHFPSGAVVRAERSRTRRYPGLEGPAPATSTLYRQCVELPSVPGIVVDVGCGSGVGTRVLREAFSRVVGVDRERLALAFAGQYEPRSEYLLADVCSDFAVRDAQAAVAIDVLGQLASPYDALASLRERLPPSAWLFVAEPLADPAQQLAFPVRRAFSPQGLSSLLTRSGFRTTSVQTANGFCALLAHPAEASDWRHLKLVGDLVKQGDPDTARRVLGTLPLPTNPAVELELSLARAMTLMAVGELSAAEHLFDRLASDHPNDARPNVALARIALANDQLDRAIAAVGAALSADPGEPSAARAFALVASTLGQDSAPAAWQRYANLSPDSEEATRGLAEALLQANDKVASQRVLARFARYRNAADGSAR